MLPNNSVMAQVFVVVAAGSVIAFISRDLGDAPLAGWVIQGPLLMQSVLSPIVGRLSDVTDRKFLAVAPPLVATAGAVMSATARNMAVLIGGGILIGATLSTISILHAIPSEILPCKLREEKKRKKKSFGAGAGLVGLRDSSLTTGNQSRSKIPCSREWVRVHGRSHRRPVSSLSLSLSQLSFFACFHCLFKEEELHTLEFERTDRI